VIFVIRYFPDTSVIVRSFQKRNVIYFSFSSRTLHYRSRDGTYAISHSNDSLPDHAYAVPARVIEMSESLTSLESGSTGFTSFPSTPVYEGNNSSQPTSLSSRGNQFGQQDYFSGSYVYV